VVVYEMATGKKAFEGKSPASVMGAIMHLEPPPMSSLQPVTPPSLDRVVKRCLAKEPDERWQSASDLTHELKWIAEGGSQAGIPTPVGTPRKNRERLARSAAVVLAFLLACTVALSLWIVSSRRAPEQRRVFTFSIEPPENGRFDGNPHVVAVSPDGSRLAFVGSDSAGNSQLWIRALDSLAARPLAGTESSTQPFWSADSRYLAFFSQGKLKKISVSGGPAQTLADAPSGVAATSGNGTWNRGGVVLFVPTLSGRVHRVDAAGGVATPITTLDASRKEIAHLWPYFLPDGKHFLFLALTTDQENNAIYVASLDSQEKKLLLNAESTVVYAPPGYLLFQREGILMAQPFDAQRIELMGEAVPIAEGVQFNPEQGRSAFSASEGILAYRTTPYFGNVQVGWFDRSGKPVGTKGVPGGFRGVDVSPDGERMATHRHDGTGGDIWLFESARPGSMSRLTFDTSEDNSMPIWSPDGSRIVFGSLRNGKWGLYQKSANGTGSEELLIESDLPKMPMSWSPDGKFIVYWVNDPKTRSDQWILPLTGERKPAPFLQSPFNEQWAQVSPDGKWIAYSSDETGRSEIYVRRFPSGDGKWQVSSNGGTFPRWRRDNRELFYMGVGPRRKIVALTVDPAGPNFEYGHPTELFDSGFTNFRHGRDYLAYAVSPDGQRFLIPRPESTDLASDRITVVLNWTAGLKE